MFTKKMPGTLKIILPYFTVIMMLITGFSVKVSAQTERRHLREGNRLYHKEQFDESELSYRRALEKDEEMPVARFNLGNALYKQERFDEAMRYFGELSEEIEDPVNRARVFHNLGNTLLRSEQIEKSIEAYKESLRNNPHDDETRYNLAFAQNLLDENQDQDQGDDDNGEGDEGDQQQDDQQQDQEGDEDTGEPESSDEQQSPDDSSPQPRPEEISPEEALRMLEAAEREDQRVQEKLMEQKESEQRPRTGRNW